MTCTSCRTKLHLGPLNVKKSPRGGEHPLPKTVVRNNVEHPLPRIKQLRKPVEIYQTFQSKLDVIASSLQSYSFTYLLTEKGNRYPDKWNCNFLPFVLYIHNLSIAKFTDCQSFQSVYFVFQIHVISIIHESREVQWRLLPNWEVAYGNKFWNFDYEY